jgi:epoxyqueuosine reductase QueG
MPEQIQMETDSLRIELETMAREQGADYFGVADLSPARDFVEAQGGPVVAGFPRAVSIGMRLFDSLVEMVEPKTEFNISPYRQHIYNVVSPRLDDISLNLARVLRKSGYDALPVPQGFSGPNKSILSYKLPAHLAGHGWIGKSCLLVTPEYGPRVRFSAVLTDAPIETGRPMDEQCGDCTICVDACPVHAFTGRSFRPDEPREARFDPGKCARFRGSEKRRGEGAEDPDKGKVFACGLCVKVCPYGNRAVNNL